MKKIHLKYSFLVGGLLVLAVLSAKVRFESKQTVHQSATQYFDNASKKDAQYRYYLQIFKMFNAR